MNLQIIENRCRICATELTDLTCLIPIFPNDASNFFLLSKIHKYLYINIQEDDSLPKSLCATCFIKIESIDKFAYSAMKNQECFVSWLQNNQRQANTVTQTTIEMSTNSDFSFSNIIIKNECPQNEQRQQIFFQPHKTPRNPRHTDHITLEQIINDQIIKNPKIPAATLITPVFEQEKPKRQRRQSQKSESKISTVSYNNLQIGELIKDYELLMLILKALKWEEYDRKATYEELIKRLKTSNCRDILSNKNLLNDNDVMQLIRCYVVANDSDMTNQNKSSPIPSNFLQQSTGDFSSHNKKVPVTVKIPTIKHPYTDDNSVTSMEVPIDPGLFLPYEEVTIDDDDDEETVSATETKIETEKMKKLLPLKIETQTLSNKEVILESNTTDEMIQKQDTIEIRNIGKYICTSCPEEFSSNSDLENHVLTHFISKTTRASLAPKTEVSIHETPKKKKDKMRDLRRKKIAIRIKLSPKKTNIKTKAKVPARFPCPICFDKQLSSKRNVNLHLESTHKINGKYRCNGNDCKKVFMKLENLLKHKTIHNSIKQKQQVVKPTSSTAVHQCLYCAKSYTTSANRILHQKKMHADKEKNEK